MRHPSPLIRAGWGRSLDALQSLALPLNAWARPVLAAAYEGLARAYSAYLLRGEARGAAYARTSLGAGDAVYGLSDIDLVAVVDGSAAKERVRRRWSRARRVLGDVIFDWPLILEWRDVEDVAGTAPQTYGLGRPGLPGLYFGPGADEERVWLAERPELYGPTSGWRHLRGPDGAPGDRSHAPGVDRIASWLELQNTWRLALQFCHSPDAHSRAWAQFMCVKMHADPLRAWLWAARGERAATRAEALEAGLRALPEEEPAIRAATGLLGELSRREAPPLGEALAFLTRMSQRLAAVLANDADSPGRREVRLEWGGAQELCLPFGAWEGGGQARLLALSDWRALASPAAPDEALALVEGDPADPARMRELTGVGANGSALPALVAGEVLVLPSASRPRSRLRSVQCAATDPVSLALVHGAESAAFPDLPGLSAGDWARRAVAEHAAWLGDPAPAPEHSGRTLGRLITATRAGLFLDSLDGDEPRLALTAAAAMRELADAGEERVAGEAAGAYAHFATWWEEVPGTTIEALRSAVTALPAYSRD